MMVSVNQLRSVQAEATLVMLMEAQLAERRAQIARMRRSAHNATLLGRIADILCSRCEAIAGRLKALKTGDAPVP